MAHSEDVLQENRELWWNEDYINLLANRWDLKNKFSLADIGMGLGHWSRLLLPYLDENFHFTGLDIEEKWVQEAPNRFYQDFPLKDKKAFSFIKSDAHEIILESDTFDIVTCQTVLMHLESPNKAFREMIRIAKPGGLIICVEPINLLNRLELSSVLYKISPAEAAMLFKFWEYFHFGKILSGNGNNDIGCELVGLFEQNGLRDIRAYQNEKVLPIFIDSSISNSEVIEPLPILEADIDFAKLGGASNTDIELAIRANNILQNTLSNQKIYAKAGSQNMFIVSGIKS